MLVTDEEVKHLKPWLIRKLEAISEADSQILSDYVLALLQAEGSQADLRVNAVENLADFLGDKTRKFVDEVFQIINTRSYIPGSRTTDVQQTARMESIQNAFPKLLTNKFDIGSGNGSAGRKRSFNESNESYVDYDSPARKQYHRFSKQPHRGWETGQGKGSRPRFTGVDNPQRGRDIGTARIPDSTTAIAMGSRPNDLRGGFRNQHQISASLPPTIHSLGTLAFDPNAALQAVMTLQAMGFPFPFPGPATEAGDSNVKVRLQKLCRNYNSKGYCSRGDKCHFKHDKSEITGNVENSKDSLTGSVSINAPHKRDSSLNGKPSKRGFVRTDGTRAVFSSTVIHGNRENFTGVVVEAIPEDCFDNNKIRGFFSKFGTIKNIIMRAYHHLAIVEYEDHASARMAFESPKVVFDNRFVKVFWYIPALDDKRASSVVETGPDVKLEEPQVDRKQFEADNELAQKKYQARQVLLKETDQKRLELAAKQKEIELKKVQEIQKMKDILAANGKILPADIESPTKNTTKEEETANLLAQLKALEDEAQSLGLESEPWSSHGLGHNNRGRGSYQGWRGYSTRSRGWGAYGRGGFIGNGAYNLDNRPKRVKVESAVEFDDAMDESLKRFLFTLGEYISVEPDTGGRTKVITFIDRITAQAFFYGSKDIPDIGALNISWVPNSPIIQVKDDAKNAKEVDNHSIPKHIKQEDREDDEIVPERNVEREDEMNDSGGEYEWIT